jgi:rubrerythrin
MSNELQREWPTYVCRTCRTRFSVERNENPVCCPVCRMNRVRKTDSS